MRWLWSLLILFLVPLALAPGAWRFYTYQPMSVITSGSESVPVNNQGHLGRIWLGQPKRLLIIGGSNAHIFERSWPNEVGKMRPDYHVEVLSYNGPALSRILGDLVNLDGKRYDALLVEIPGEEHNTDFPNVRFFDYSNRLRSFWSTAGWKKGLRQYFLSWWRMDPNFCERVWGRECRPGTLVPAHAIYGPGEVYGKLAASEIAVKAPLEAFTRHILGASAKLSDHVIVIARFMQPHVLGQSIRGLGGKLHSVVEYKRRLVAENLLVTNVARKLGLEVLSPIELVRPLDFEGSAEELDLSQVTHFGSNQHLEFAAIVVQKLK